MIRARGRELVRVRWVLRARGSGCVAVWESRAVQGRVIGGRAEGGRLFVDAGFTGVGRGGVIRARGRRYCDGDRVGEIRARTEGGRRARPVVLTRGDPRDAWKVVLLQ